MKPFLVAVLLAALSTFAVPSPMLVPAQALAVAVTADACGTQPVKSDGTRWQCTFVDTFSGPDLDRTKWTPATWFVTGSSTVYACYRDEPSNVRVKYGALRLTMQKLAAPAPCANASLAPTRYQSGMVSTYHQFSQQYGRVEARIKVTATSAPGLHEAFWMWPDDRYGSTSPWPYSGEMDIAETFSIHNKVAVSALHYSADADGMQPGVNMNACPAKRGVWNTYALEWTPTRIEFFVNGKSCLVNTSGDVAFQKPYIINLTEAIGPEAMGNMPVAGTPFPATMQVDYVKVWK